MFGLNADHFLAPALAALFDDELHVDEGMIAEIAERFGEEVDLAIERRGPSALRGLGD